jgi:hypothetical protein
MAFEAVRALGALAVAAMRTPGIEVTLPDEFIEPRSWGGRIQYVTPIEAWQIQGAPEFVPTCCYPISVCLLTGEIGRYRGTRVVVRAA